MSNKTYDERDMPRIADAYDDLEFMVLDEKVEIEVAIKEIAAKYELSESDKGRILGWLSDEMATLEGDAEGQDRLDEDH